MRVGLAGVADAEGVASVAGAVVVAGATGVEVTVLSVAGFVTRTVHFNFLDKVLDFFETLYFTLAVIMDFPTVSPVIFVDFAVDFVILTTFFLLVVHLVPASFFTPETFSFNVLV